MRSLLPSVFAFIASLALATTATAQDPATEGDDSPTGGESTEGVPQHVALDEAEARALFEAGVLAFQNTRFEDALERFNRAFELSGRTELLFNVGLAADRLRRDELAIDAFERFLQSDPPPNFRRQAEARLDFLRREVAAEAEEEEADAEPMPVAEASTSEEQPEGDDLGPGAVEEESEGGGAGPWVLGAVGLAFAAVGGGLLAGALASSNAVTDASDGSRWDDLSGRADRGPVLQGIGWAMLGVGVAGLVGAVLWLALGPPDEDASVALTADGLRVQWESL